MSHHVLMVYLTVVVAQMDERDLPYCNIRYERLCQGKGQHVGCQFPYPGAGESCVNYTEIAFSDSLKHFVLHYVNRRRQRIAAGQERVRGGGHLPKPEVMMLVQWDRELAYLAQRLADQCRFVHDDCRATVRYPYAGQTVGEVRWRRAGESAEAGARATIGRVFDAWWGERRRVLPAQLTQPFTLTGRGAVWGHFSQLAVWTLRAMGCGAVHHGTSRPRLLLVCDFSHTNMLGQRTISPGSLGPCPFHTMRIHSSRYPLLCSPVHHSQFQTPEPQETYYDEEAEDQAEGTSDEPLTTEVLRIRPDKPLRPEQEEDAPSNIEERTRTLKKIGDPPARVQDARVSGLREKLDREVEKNRESETKQRELMMRQKAVHKIDMSRDWELEKEEGPPWDIMKLPDHQKPWRETNERPQEANPLRRQMSSKEVVQRGDTTLPAYRPTTVLLTEEPYLRQRWKRPRNRPRRPGANALLTTTLINSKRTGKATTKHSKASLMMDPEDVDQLFRDTGFKLSTPDNQTPTR